MSDDNTSHKPASSKPDPAAVPGQGEEVLSFLADFENSVDSLKKLCASKPRAGVLSHSAAASAASLAAAAERSEADRRQIAELRASLETVRTDLAKRSIDLEQRSEEVERLRAELAQEVDRQRSVTQQHELDLREREAAREARDAELARQEQAISSKLSALAAEVETVQNEKTRLTLTTESFESRKAQLESLQEGIETKLQEIERREKALDECGVSGDADSRIAELNARLIDARSLAESKSGELAELRRMNEVAQAEIAALQSQILQVQSSSAPWGSNQPDLQAVQVRQRLEELLVETRNELETARAQVQEQKTRGQQLEASLDDMRRQNGRVTDTTLQLHEENDALKVEIEAMRTHLEDSARAAHMAQIQDTEQNRRLESAAATIAALENKLKERPDLDPIRAQIRKELEVELQGPIVRSAQRADTAESALAAAQEELSSLRARLAQESGRTASLEARLTESARAASDQEERLAEQVAQNGCLNSDLAALENSLRAEQDRLAEVSQTAKARETELADLSSRAATLERSLTEARDAALRHESSSQRIAEELAVVQKRLAESEASSKELRDQVESVGSRSDADRHTISSLEHDLAAARAHIELTQTQQTAAQTALDECRVRFENERISLQTALGEASTEREQIAQQFAAATDLLAQKSAQISEIESSLKSAAVIAAKADSLRQDNARLGGRLRDAMEVAEAAAARIRELETMVESSQDQVVTLEARVSEIAAATSQSSDVEGMRAKFELLKDRLRAEVEARDADAEKIEALETKVAALQRHNATSGKGLPAGRIERLQAHRKLRRDQNIKLRNLGDALRSRFEICEQIIAQRAQLAAAHQLVTETQRKVQSKQASSRVTVVAFFGAMTLLILTFLSWAAAGQLFPGRYAARVTIEADGRGRELPATELQEWQKFHQDLLASPAFSDTLAEHMKQFGLTSLAAPGAVAQRLKQDLSVESPGLGQIVMEFHGDGAARTARELNAISTKFAAESQELRTRRSDGAITTITKPAAALPDPIDNSRIMGTLGILGGSVSLASIIAYLLYRKLSSAKTKFENEIALDALLDAKRWPDPTLGMDSSRRAA